MEAWTTHDWLAVGVGVYSFILLVVVPGVMALMGRAEW